MPSNDHIWDAAAEEEWWREELESMKHGADAIERQGLNTTGFYVACLGALDATSHFTKAKYFSSRSTFVAELRRLVTEPTAPSRHVPSVEEYHRTQGRWLECAIKEYDRDS